MTDKEFQTTLNKMPFPQLAIETEDLMEDMLSDQLRLTRLGLRAEALGPHVVRALEGAMAEVKPRRRKELEELAGRVRGTLARFARKTVEANG